MSLHQQIATVLFQMSRDPSLPKEGRARAAVQWMFLEHLQAIMSDATPEQVAALPHGPILMLGFLLLGCAPDDLPERMGEYGEQILAARELLRGIAEDAGITGLPEEKL